MRSRDGDNYFTFTICTIIFLFSSVSFLRADEYLISYRCVVKDAMLYNETLNISKAMKSCNLNPTKGSLILEKYDKNNLKATISKNKSEFLSFIQKLPLNVEHYEQNRNLENSSTTIITLKSTCFKVDFNENFARITPLK